VPGVAVHRTPRVLRQHRACQDQPARTCADGDGVVESGPIAQQVLDCDRRADHHDPRDACDDGAEHEYRRIRRDTTGSPRLRRVGAQRLAARGHQRQQREDRQ
jgi:hypothetical protein